MIWYILYPFRATSKPPRLSVNHPVRRAFYRHGILTAQHWLAAMLVSCTIASMLAYPTVFLSGNPTAGLTSKPHQIWAAARPISDSEGQHVDIEMRQLWVHGTYMKALQEDVLHQALEIQEKLVGAEDLATIHSDASQDPTTPVQWGFHSPLMYWNNSARLIDEDEDIIKTVNDQSRSSSSLDISLRPASVFAGKSFSRNKLVAADALVLTLMNRQEHSLGQKWQHTMHSVDDFVCRECQLYPPPGQVSKSWLYELTLTPVTLEENIALAFAYTLMVLYVLVSLRRLKAFHSRFGLVVTAVTQMIMSILASFTICRTVVKVNLVAVPQNAYPFIVLVIGLENMFRLINAILAYPATMATDLRIANALGDVGPLSVATAAQNLLVLWLLSKVVSSGMVAFCAFAAIATVVDTFFLLTFFVAVLNVDIRRLELQDSIAKSKDAAQRQKAPATQRTWFDALLHGGLPLSTRMAGSVVTTTFILTLNYHFFERSDRQFALGRMLGYSGAANEDSIQFDTITSPPMNATLTPGEWVRMQDFDTAREVLRLVNKGAQSFVIRVFAPLVVVLSGADRTGVPLDSPSWRQNLMSITRHHVYPFVIVIAFTVTFVWVLMNFLLWNDAPEMSEEVPDRVEDPIAVEHIKTTHKLDIIKIAANNRGDIITAALDRTVSISVVDPSTGIRATEVLPTDIANLISWPVRLVAIDASGQWVALQHGHHDILICDRKEGSVIAFLTSPDDSSILLFDFTTLTDRDGDHVCFIAISASGTMTVQVIRGRQLSSSKISEQRLIAASVLSVGAHGRRVAALTENAELRLVDLRADSAHTEDANATVQLALDRDGKLDTATITSTMCAGETIYLVRTPGALLLTDSQHTLCTLAIEGSGPILLSSPTECRRCGGIAFTDIGAIGDGVLSASEILVCSFGYQVTLDERAMCVHNNKHDCPGLAQAVRSEHLVDNPGFYTSLAANGVLGLRRKQIRATTETVSVLRRRRDASRIASSDVAADDVWEAYHLSLDGECTTVSFSATESASMDDPDLYVTTAGPGVVIDTCSVAIAFGNAIKVLKMAKTGISSASSGITRDVSAPRKGRGLFRKAQ